ncbi:hypothetical protein FW778_14260 [Ginsengibacter hankyongi]|uniref:Lipoprotein n=1 Tax=Ginsengibacter hankyongi TaxID=2607284 RepID=A0A5J5IHG5_9BACT|nr:hypothetical protein [Ginsengibacter hankyongi]KAA9038706.1 hypothetical protein FW778_14260 [Ginsengibacter hankyongi]
MKNSIMLTAVLIASFFYGCKKHSLPSSVTGTSTPFFDSAVQYLQFYLSSYRFNQLDFSKSKILTNRYGNAGILVFERGNDDTKFLLLKKTKSGYFGNWIDLSGLKGSSHYRSGEIFIDRIDDVSMTTLKVDSNKVVKNETMYKTISKFDDTYFDKSQYLPKRKTPSSLEKESAVLPEVIIYYDVNSSGVDYFSWYWLLDQMPSSSYDYFTAGSGGGGGDINSSSSGYTPVVFSPTFYSPDEPILDLGKELRCFSIDATSTYSISVNVNQPDPGTRDIINPLSSFPVGHTYLTLEQHNADGSSVIRNVGFYPRNTVKPGSETDESVFGEDSYTPYDVTLTFVVTGPEMNTVIGRIEDQQALQYDLNNFNCTNSAMDALKSINVNLPSTKADETLFSGNDPGDLGEDIRNMNLDNFSSQNGNRKITRTVSNSNNQYPKGKAGTCG